MLMVIMLERTPFAAAPIGFLDAIAANSDGHIQIARSTWLVIDWDAGPVDWTAALQPFVGPNDRLMIFETTNNYGGLAPQVLWNWCEQAIVNGHVTPSRDGRSR